MKKVLLIIALGLLTLKAKSQNYSVNLGIGAVLGAGAVSVPQLKIETPERAALMGGGLGFVSGLTRGVFNQTSEPRLTAGSFLFSTAGGVIGAITAQQIKAAIAKRRAKKIVLSRL